MKLGVVWEVKIWFEGKAALYIQNRLLRLHNGKESGKKGGNPVDPENRIRGIIESKMRSLQCMAGDFA